MAPAARKNPADVLQSFAALLPTADVELSLHELMPLVSLAAVPDGLVAVTRPPPGQ
jgi:hypothetical protein